MSPAAQYLEARFTRIEHLRAIAKRLCHQLYGPDPALHLATRFRLKNRLKRVHRHIAHLTGGSK